ncbi:MAG TPA: hypothetical protein VKA38_15410, partial [Draconibacterium sp.]|nr:hypothetical protein [Draconibacterium sp.]
KTDSLSSNVSGSHFWGETDTLFCNYEKTDSLKKQILFTNGEKAEKIELRTDEKWLSAGHSIKLTPEARYGSRILLNDVNQYDYLNINIWAFCKDEKQVHLVSEYGEKFYFHCNESDTINPLGWRKYEMGYWVPKNSDSSECSMHIWNSGETPVFIDNLEIIKKNLASNLSP